MEAVADSYGRQAPKALYWRTDQDVAAFIFNISVSEPFMRNVKINVFVMSV